MIAGFSKLQRADGCLVAQLLRPAPPHIMHGVCGGLDCPNTAVEFLRQVMNPATGEVIAKVPHAKGPETRAAIAEAAAVFPKWSGLPAKERSKILRKCAGCR